MKNYTNKEIITFDEIGRSYEHYLNNKNFQYILPKIPPMRRRKDDFAKVYNKAKFILEHYCRF